MSTSASPRRRRSLAAARLLAAATLGGGVAAGSLTASGAISPTPAASTTVVQAPARLTPAADVASAGAPSASALYASAAASVVDITARGTTSSDSGANPYGGGSGPFGQQQQSIVATGTGFVMDADGHLMTAAHVVDGARTITVRFSDATTRTARLVGEDKSSDVAVLQVDRSGLTLHPLALGSSSRLRVGDAVYAIGDPYGYQRSLSTGVVSGLGRTIQAPNGFSIPGAVQTDAALNPGNSGGPLLNAQGQVVGIADQIVAGSSSAGDGSSGAASTGIGFAVPIDVARATAQQLIATGHATHPYLGVATADASAGATQSGASVASVQAGSPGARAGLRAGDVVVSADGRAVRGSGDLVAVIAGHRPGDALRLTVRRGGSTLTVTATLGTQPSQAPGASG